MSGGLSLHARHVLSARTRTVLTARAIREYARVESLSASRHRLRARVDAEQYNALAPRNISWRISTRSFHVLSESVLARPSGEKRVSAAAARSRRAHERATAMRGPTPELSLRSAAKHSDAIFSVRERCSRCERSCCSTRAACRCSRRLTAARASLTEVASMERSADAKGSWSSNPHQESRAARNCCGGTSASSAAGSGSSCKSAVAAMRSSPCSIGAAAARMLGGTGREGTDGHNTRMSRTAATARRESRPPSSLPPSSRRLSASSSGLRHQHAARSSNSSICRTTSTLQPSPSLRSQRACPPPTAACS
mmetsp:Transcript_8017/g.18788  ORF Transcript_8017/g.18788 Transcript_8017/m.18788 type:complete len:310 (+) Transcript_8017:2996-3925(+)